MRMAKKLSEKKVNVSLRANDSIGHAGAEDDVQLLTTCFIKNASYEAMIDINDPKCILIGGTGAGKTALIEMLAHEKPGSCIKLDLADVSFRYVSNSNVLNMLEGFKLDIIYKYIWRNFFAIQLLKKNTIFTIRILHFTIF